MFSYIISALSWGNNQQPAVQQQQASGEPEPLSPKNSKPKIPLSPLNIPLDSFSPKTPSTPTSLSPTNVVNLNVIEGNALLAKFNQLLERLQSFQKTLEDSNAQEGQIQKVWKSFEKCQKTLQGTTQNLVESSLSKLKEWEEISKYASHYAEEKIKRINRIWYGYDTPVNESLWNSYFWLNRFGIAYRSQQLESNCKNIKVNNNLNSDETFKKLQTHLEELVAIKEMFRLYEDETFITKQPEVKQHIEKSKEKTKKEEYAKFVKIAKAVEDLRQGILASSNSSNKEPYNKILEIITKRMTEINKLIPAGFREPQEPDLANQSAESAKQANALEVIEAKYAPLFCELQDTLKEIVKIKELLEAAASHPSLQAHIIDSAFIDRINGIRGSSSVNEKGDFTAHQQKYKNLEEQLVRLSELKSKEEEFSTLHAGLNQQWESLLQLQQSAKQQNQLKSANVNF